jgi:hypothetical protein
MSLFKLGILLGLLAVCLVRWHAWVATSDDHVRAQLECEQRNGWVLIDGKCVAGSQRVKR